MTSVHVIETLVDRGFAALRFVDGGSRFDPVNDDRRLITSPLMVDFTTVPNGARVLNRDGTWKILLNDQHDTVDGLRGESFIVDLAHGADAPSDAILAPDVVPPITVSGTVTDPTGAWLPRPFSLTLARGQIEPVELFRTPAGVQKTAGGSLIACIAWISNAAPAAWAQTTLTVTVGPRQFIMRGRCDQHGEVVIPLTRLPPLDKGLPPYDGKLTVRATPPLPGVAIEAIPSDTGVVNCVLRHAADINTEAIFSLPLTPGTTHRAESHLGKRHLLITPSP